MNNNTDTIPARFRLMQQEDFVRKFHKRVISTLNVYEAAVCRSDVETAERMQSVLRTELADAIAVIGGDTSRWNIKNEFTKVGSQEAQLLNE